MKMTRRTALLLMGALALLPACARREGAEDPPKAEEKPNLGPTAETLAQAVYPETVAYDQDYEKWKLWQDARRARWALRDSYAGAIDGFYEASIPQFLRTAQDDNPVYAPMNVYMALSLLAEVTDGESREQILRLLGRDGIEDARTVANALWQANYSDDGVSKLLLANSLWLRNDMDYSEAAVQTLAEDYYASTYRGAMGSDEYNKLLQDWLNEQTSGLLQQQAGGIKLDAETLLALASTVYFKASWQSEFDAAVTEPDTFHGPAGDVTADFMHRTIGSSSGLYYRGEDFGAVRLDFQETDAAMYLVLPDEGVSPDALLQEGEAVQMALAGWEWPNTRKAEIRLSLPKFDVTASYDLREGLAALGVTDVMDPDTADFSAILTDYNDGAYLGQATHAARVKIDEEGCEAAAFTVMAAMGTALILDPEIIEFTLDRPFLFFLTAPDGGILFAGAVNKP